MSAKKPAPCAVLAIVASSGQKGLMRCACGFVYRQKDLDMSRARILDFLLDAYNDHVKGRSGEAG